MEESTHYKGLDRTVLVTETCKLSEYVINIRFNRFKVKGNTLIKRLNFTKVGE